MFLSSASSAHFHSRAPWLLVALMLSGNTPSLSSWKHPPVHRQVPAVTVGLESPGWGGSPGPGSLSGARASSPLAHLQTLGCTLFSRDILGSQGWKTVGAFAPHGQHFLMFTLQEAGLELSIFYSHFSVQRRPQGQGGGVGRESGDLGLEPSSSPYLFEPLFPAVK